MEKFKLGQCVEVVDTGRHFGYYEKWAKEYNLGYWVEGQTLTNGVQGIVIAVGKHLGGDYEGEDLLGIRDKDGKEYIIGSGGVKLTEDSVTLCNGVDALGTPLHFTPDMLKPFMRVVTKAEGEWLMVPNVAGGPSYGDLIMVKEDAWSDVFTPETERANISSIYMGYAALEIYAPPKNNTHLLKVNHRGELVWKYKEPEKVEQAYPCGIREDGC